MGRTRKAEPTSPPSSPDSAQPAVPDRELHRPGQAPGGGGVFRGQGLGEAWTLQPSSTSLVGH